MVDELVQSGVAFRGEIENFVPRPEVVYSAALERCRDMFTFQEQSYTGEPREAPWKKLVSHVFRLR